MNDKAVRDHSPDGVCSGQKLVRNILARSPAATPSVILPRASVVTEGDGRTSLILHPGGAASKSATQ